MPERPPNSINYVGARVNKCRARYENYYNISTRQARLIVRRVCRIRQLIINRGPRLMLIIHIQVLFGCDIYFLRVRSRRPNYVIQFDM